MRVFLPIALLACSFAQAPSHPAATDPVERDLRADVGFLASDAMQGRGTGTQFEAVAAEYLAAQLEEIGLEPGGDAAADGKRGYLQHFDFQYGSIPKRMLRVLNQEDRAGKGTSQNVIGVLRGATDDAIIISAHYDHIAPKPVSAPGEDVIYNGADDDASGTAIVLELARTLAKGAKPKRTVYFILFGAEEFGGVGSDYFNEHPPLPLTKVIANLEFEMIGRPDPKVAPGTLWLTGYERSDLGPTLAKRGAPLVADPHPEYKFFERSDNYQLALRGIVAHTVSSYGLHKEYHQPSDDVAHMDFAHLSAAVRAMLEPVKWLANSDFKPTWVPGQQPQPKTAK
jgi:Zn-dependent M28 family amino/carboxypeptidase